MRIKNEDWFGVHVINDKITVIRERLDLIDPRFRTKFSNIFLIHGDHSSILFDTGCGIGNLKEFIKPHIGGRELLVFNSHNHFDHVGGNHFFEKVYVHRLDIKKLMEPIMVDFLKDSGTKFADEFAKNDYQLISSAEHRLVIGNEMFDLGGTFVKILHTPGHTPGSICLLMDEVHLFTGDTFHHGAIYLPNFTEIKNYIITLEELSSILPDKSKIYPGHEKFELDKKELECLLEISREISPKSTDWIRDDFLDSLVKTVDEYTFVLPVDGSI